MSDLNLMDVVSLIRAEIARTEIGDTVKITGPAGEQGPQGEAGIQGPQGPRGNDGKQGPAGAKGNQGKKGDKGVKGDDGADGVGIARIDGNFDNSFTVILTDGTQYEIDMPLVNGDAPTEVHYKVSGSSGSGDGGGSSGSVDLSGYVRRPNANLNGSWLVYREGGDGKSGVKEWAPVTTDLVATNPDVTFRDAKGRFRSTSDLDDLTNQLKVNRFLANEVELLNEAVANLAAGSVVVSDDPPNIEADGQLWYDSNRLELFVSYQDAWISTSPLESRIEAGEALQAEILGRVEAGEAKQVSIETNAMTKGGAQTLTADNWSIKDDGGATYAMISNGEITMYHVATPGAPKQPTNKEYVDKADNEMKRRIDELESMVAELGGVIVRYRYVYNSEQGNARQGTFNIKTQDYAVTKNVKECRYIEFSTTDADGNQPVFPNIKDKDLVRIVGPSGERVDYINDGNMDETPVLLIDGFAFSDFDEFAEGSQYTVTIVGAK